MIKAADTFKNKTVRPNQLWQTDFTYLKAIGWGLVLALDHPRRLLALYHRLERLRDDADRRRYQHAGTGAQGIRLRPGKPTDNAYIGSFNGSLRDECLNVHWFANLEDAKEKLQAWQKEYNGSRPHRSLNNLSPNDFADHWATKRQKIATPSG